MAQLTAWLDALQQQLLHQNLHAISLGTQISQDSLVPATACSRVALLLPLPLPVVCFGDFIAWVLSLTLGTGETHVATTTKTSTSYNRTVSIDACTPCPSVHLEAINADDGTSRGFVELTQDDDGSQSYRSNAFIPLATVTSQSMIDAEFGTLITLINGEDHVANIHDAMRTFFFDTLVPEGEATLNCLLMGGELQCGRVGDTTAGTFQTCTNSSPLTCVYKRGEGDGGTGDCNTLNRRIVGPVPVPVPIPSVGAELRFYPFIKWYPRAVRG